MQSTGRVVRRRTGSQRPSGIDPDVWAKFYTIKDRAKVVKEYGHYLAAVKAAVEAGESPDSVPVPAYPAVLGGAGNKTLNVDFVNSAQMRDKHHSRKGGLLFVSLDDSLKQSQATSSS